VNYVWKEKRYKYEIDMRIHASIQYKTILSSN